MKKQKESIRIYHRGIYPGWRTLCLMAESMSMVLMTALMVMSTA